MQTFEDLARVAGRKAAIAQHVKYAPFAKLESLRTMETINRLNPFRTRGMRQAWIEGFVAEIDTAFDARID